MTEKHAFARAKFYHWIAYCVFLGFGVFLVLMLVQDAVVDSFSFGDHRMGVWHKGPVHGCMEPQDVQDGDMVLVLVAIQYQKDGEIHYRWDPNFIMLDDGEWVTPDYEYWTNWKWTDVSWYLPVKSLYPYVPLKSEFEARTKKSPWENSQCP